VAALFRKPSLIVDELNLYDLDRFPERVMLILKKIQNLKTGKIISFQEAYEKKLNYIGGHLELNKLGYKLINNSELEIKSATESFFNLINNNLNLDESLQKQKKILANC
jgi:putative glycosyltransferase (TIGR04372 family)